jgi:hypothetical protein
MDVIGELEETIKIKALDACRGEIYIPSVGEEKMLRFFKKEYPATKEMFVHRYGINREATQTEIIEFLGGAETLAKSCLTPRQSSFLCKEHKRKRLTNRNGFIFVSFTNYFPTENGIGGISFRVMNYYPKGSGWFWHKDILMLPEYTLNKGAKIYITSEFK